MCIKLILCVFGLQYYDVPNLQFPIPLKMLFQERVAVSRVLTAAVNTSRINRTVAVTYSEPYWTSDGIARSIEVYDRSIDSSSLPVARYSSRTLGGAVGFGVPVTETDSVILAVRYEHTNLSLVSDSAPIYVDFVTRFGSSTNSYSVSSGWWHSSTLDNHAPVPYHLGSDANQCTCRGGYLLYNIRKGSQISVPENNGLVSRVRPYP